MKTLVFILCLSLYSLAHGTERLALIIGNSSYLDVPLANPRNDARLMADTLSQLGFDVDVLIDADRRAMKRSVFRMARRLEQAGQDSVGVFYYAGHGIQVDGINYLIPLGAEIEREFDVEIEAINADAIVNSITKAENYMNVL